MLLFNQLELAFSTKPSRQSGRDLALETEAAQLLTAAHADSLAANVRVEWSGRLRSAAGRASYRDRLVTLNLRLHEHGAAEIDRTLRHELAHLLAHSRAGRRRIAPHGREWREACRDLGIGGETRCHTLPFPVSLRARPFRYVCPKCRREFPRASPIRRQIACLACCRSHNRGRYHSRYRLQLVPETNVRNLSP